MSHPDQSSRTSYLKAWRVANRERIAAYARGWNARNPQKRRQTEASWKARNPEKVRQYNRTAGRRWEEANKGQRTAITKKRQLAKRNRTPAWADLDAIKAFYVEAARLTAETGIPHEVDHVIPLQGENVSGLHVHTNLQILTRAKNRAKRNRIL